MEKIIKKLFFGTSAVALTALALAPIAAVSDNSAYAATQDQKTPQFSVTVNPTLTLDSVTTPETLNFSTAALKTSTFSVLVTSNKNYVIQLSAAQPNLMSGSNSIPASNDFSTSKSGWGIKKFGEDSYTAITTTPTTFRTFTIDENTANKQQTTDFTYGIGVAAGQASGTYSTTVTVTATTAAS